MCISDSVNDFSVDFMRVDSIGIRVFLTFLFARMCDDDTSSDDSIDSNLDMGDS